ncbi:MAG: toxin-antitoxin system YwqK family antitoxin [Planctomycetes bacterium]|nr:toxin-antitoxin system YwqK family antitoxin [Planctomycetota bacterium]
MSRRLLDRLSFLSAVLGWCALVGACNSGVQASDPEESDARADTNVGAHATSTPTAGSPANKPASDFERRWSYLAPNSLPDKSAPAWNGEIDGPVTLWHDNGTKRGEGRYENSRRVGAWVFWHENGRLRWQGTYVDGELDGRELAWFENGQMQLECYWKDGRREGVFAQWHENGQLAAQGEYRNGKREGRFHYYNADGTADPTLTGHYAADVRVGG